MSSRSKLAKILRRTLLPGTVLLLILLSLITFFSTTERGLNLLLTGLQDATNKQFTFARAQGSLLSQFSLTGLKYQDSHIKLAIREFHFHWRINDLLNKTFTIEQFTAAGIRLTQLSPAEDNSSSPMPPEQAMISLPSISLPLAIKLKQLQISDIQLLLLSETPGELRTEQIDQLSISAALNNSQLTIEHLRLAARQYHALQIKLNGSAELRGNYPLKLHSEVQLAPLAGSNSAQQTIKLSGGIQGDLSQLHIKQNSSGLFDAQLNFQLTELLKNLHWTGRIKLTRLPLKFLDAADYPQLTDRVLNADIHSSGDLSQAQSSISSRLPDNNGTLNINSNISWHDGIRWQAELLTEKLNPGLLQPDWPGSLTMALYSDGTWSSGQLTTQIQLKNLAGSLRQQSVQGTGQFQLSNKRITIEHLQLSSGSAQLSADGQLDSSSRGSNINWSVSIKQLADLLPHAQGSINARGSINGHFADSLTAQQQQFTLQAKLRADDIVYESTQLQHAELHMTLHSDLEKPSQLQFNAQSLQLDTQTFKNIEVRLDGPLKEHRLQLKIAHEQLSAELLAQGQFELQPVNWSGEIRQLVIDSSALGQWQQEAPARLSVSTEKLSLATLCLNEVSASGKLCTEINQNSNAGTAHMHLSQLSFAHLKPWLPEEISQFSGALNILADINLAPQLQAQIKADILPGKLIFQTLSQEPVSLSHQNGHISADYNATELSALWQINLGPHSLEGNIRIPRTALEKEAANAPLQGELRLAVSDLELISILVPQINEIKGQLDAHMQLGGTLNAPAVTGQANFTAAYLTIRDTGTRIENIELSIVEKNAGQALNLQGKLHAGDGQLDINGLLQLDADRGWPLTLTLKGRDFLAVDLPEIYAVISPDIQFSQNKGLMHLKGNIFVPTADITINSIPEDSVGVSPDVEILGSEKSRPANIDLNISLELGRENTVTGKKSAGVRLDAFGLKSKLAGKITLQQKPGQLVTAQGQLHLIDGTFRAYGQDLNIEQGDIFYAGGYIDNPGIRLSASRQLADTKVGIKVAGSARKPRINTFSDDTTLDSKDIIAMLLTGQKVDNLENAKVYAGTEISDGLSVGVNAGAGDEGSEFITRFKLTDKIQLEGTSSASKSGGSIIYTFEVE